METKSNSAIGGTHKESRDNFVSLIVSKDVEDGKFGGRVQTRFPPEPNGYLHIGHVKSICLNFGIAADHQGVCSLRLDDTNPAKEESEFVQSIIEDVSWLGFDWGNNFHCASDYFSALYKFAMQLIHSGKAYVDSLSAEDIRAYRGTLKEPGQDSPYRNRPVEENIDLFERMRKGEFKDGSHVVRAKIDMSSSNINLRDPVMYRILHMTHHRTGNEWCIYPMYDFAHGQCDSIEGVTHSICTLEFENNRPLYDWFLNELDVDHPRQIEFARLNLNYTVLSKRKLASLVEGGYVSGWDDPRMPTISGMRRRGYTPEALREFCEKIGVAKRNTVVDLALLEHTLRQHLNKTVHRAMGVLRPIRVVIVNYPEDQVEQIDAINNPEDSAMGTRKVPFSRVLYIERDDFLEDPPKKFYRLAPGREVRLRYAYYIKCESVIRNPETGEIEELRCTYDPDTRGGYAPDGRKVKATLHWVSAVHAVDAEVRLYDRLFTVENPASVPMEDLDTILNPASLQTIYGCKLEPSIADINPGSRFQLERQGYFSLDIVDSSAEHLVLNRTVTLRDSWARIQKANKNTK